MTDSELLGKDEAVDKCVCQHIKKAHPKQLYALFGRPAGEICQECDCNQFRAVQT